MDGWMEGVLRLHCFGALEATADILTLANRTPWLDATWGKHISQNVQLFF